MLLASDFDQSRFLKGEGFKQEKKFRIKEVTSEVLTDRKGKAEKKLLVWFTNSEQGLSLNKTNLRTLQGAFGDDTAKWKDKVIVIFPVMTEVGPGLRVRIPPPKPATVASQQPQATAAPQPPAAPHQPVTSGNGATAPAPAGNGAPAAAAAPVAAPASLAAAAAPPLAAAAMSAVDPELEPDPVKPIREELDDEIPW